MSFATAAITQEETLRKQVMSVVERLGRKYPSMRFGQIVCLAAFLARGPSGRSAWQVTDEELLRASLEHLAGHPNP